MMVVLLILMTATAMAAASLQSTQFEIRAAGYNRSAVQMQYVSEAAAMTTLAWVDATSMDRSFLDHLGVWSGRAPSMVLFGEPEVPTTNLAMANRTQWRQQMLLTNVRGMPPITEPGTNNDALGTFGPRSTYVPGIQDRDPGAAGTTDYVVDMYDCRQLPNTAAPGSQVNRGGSGSLRQLQYYCVVTSRGRAYVPGGPDKEWTVRNQAFRVNRFTMAHDSRGTIMTPPILMNQ